VTAGSTAGAVMTARVAATTLSCAGFYKLLFQTRNDRPHLLIRRRMLISIGSTDRRVEMTGLLKKAMTELYITFEFLNLSFQLKLVISQGHLY
jgi:hypothetical protein